MPDDLLTRLGALAREQEREGDPDLDKLVSGELDAGGRAALDARAAEDPELKRRVEQLAPVSDALRDRIVKQALAQLASPAKVTELKPPARKRALWLAPVGGVLAAAAAVMLMVRAPRVEELPAYSLSAQGGVDVERGSTRQGPLVLVPDSTLQVVMRPASDVTSKVEVRALLKGGATVRELSVQPEVSATGSVRIRAQASTLFAGEKGSRELWLITCRPEVCEVAVSHVRTSGELSGPGWQAQAQPLILE